MMHGVFKTMAGLLLMLAVARGVMMRGNSMLDDQTGGVLVCGDSPTPPLAVHPGRMLAEFDPLRYLGSDR